MVQYTDDIINPDFLNQPNLFHNQLFTKPLRAILLEHGPVNSFLWQDVPFPINFSMIKRAIFDKKPPSLPNFD